MVVEEGHVLGCGLIIINNGKILLEERSDGQGWCCPGGKIDEMESADNAVVRECYEEAGLTVDIEDITLVDVIKDEAIVHGEVRKVKSFIFYTEKFSGELKAQEREVSDIKWFDIEDIPWDRLFRVTRKALTVAKDKGFIS